MYHTLRILGVLLLALMSHTTSLRADDYFMPLANIYHFKGTSGDAKIHLESSAFDGYDQAVVFKDPGIEWHLGQRFQGPTNSFGLGRDNKKQDLIFSTIPSHILMSLGNKSESARFIIESTTQTNWDQAIIFKDPGIEWHLGQRYQTPNQFGIGHDTYKNDFVITPTGNIGIGTSSPGSYKLAVEGKLGAREVNVQAGAWADFVFDPDYRPMDLVSVETFVRKNRHLPDMPAQSEVAAKGIDLGSMQAKLLQKVEELTLHLIEQEKQISALKVEVKTLKLGNCG